MSRSRERSWGSDDMANMNMIQSLNSALDIMLERDETVLMFGEDVGYFGGVFRVSDGLQAKHGAHRVFDSPLAEGASLQSPLAWA